MGKTVAEVEKRFEGGLPLLDGVKDLGITEPAFGSGPHSRTRSAVGAGPFTVPLQRT